MSTENRFEFIEDGEPYIIAEVGGNHGGSVKKAKEYVTAAAESGADSVKFQLYQAENLILEDEPPLPLAGDSYNTQFERFKELELTRSEWREIIQLCDSVGIDFSASVFDAELLKFAVDHMPFVKIASGDMTNIPLLRKVVKTGKPILLSTGFSSMDEIECVMRKLSDANVIPLHCMGCYPTDEEDANLTMIEELSQTFGDPVGYSDHTVGTLTPVTAVSKGARVVEKHFTFDKSQELGDHRLSANVSEMKEIVEKSHRVYNLSGEPRENEIYPCEDKIRSNMRRSLASKNAIQEGAKITEEDLIALRPSDGISPLRLGEIVGKTATRSIEPKNLLYESDIN